MPRNGSGTYSLPAGNPVVSGTTIQASWANSTLADISTELTGSLARNGAGGMLGALRGVDGTVSVPAFSFTSETTSGFYRAGTGDVRFAMAGADVYTVTSTGVGIGTSSPGAKLEVASGKVLLSNTQSYAIRTNSGASCDVVTLTSGNVLQLGGGGATDSIQFWNQGLQRMTLDSSGNLGLGVTPSPAQRLDVVTTSATVAKFTRDLATDVSLTIGADNDGAIIGTDGVNVMRMFTGGTERMRLDASGNIGLNGTFPSAWFGYKALQSDQSSLYESGITVGLSSNSYFPSAGTSWTRISALATARYDITSGVHKWFADASGAAGGSFTPTERMQLDNSGNLLVGTTTLAGAGGVSFQSQSGTGFAVINNNNAGATGYVFSSYRRSSTEIGSITQNGTTAVLFNTTSDRRLKDNIVPAPSASDVIDAIEIVSHDWKAAPDEHVTYGVIAQDLALVAPQAVLQGDDGDEIEKTWGVDYSKLVPMLIKEIQSLRARVAALEAA